MAQAQTQSSDNKFRLMEEEMNRFEAEIAHHQTVATTEAVDSTPAGTAVMAPNVKSSVPSAGNVTGSSFPALQPAVALPSNFHPSLQGSSAVVNSSLFPTIAVPPSQSMYMPPQIVSYQQTGFLPTNFYGNATRPVLSTPSNQPQQRTTYPSSSQAEKATTTPIRKPLSSAPLSASGGESKPKSTTTAPATTTTKTTTTVIVAPPQMAGPNELAARAKETAAAHSKSASAKKDPVTADHQDDGDIEVDDDVTRALLAAAAGVTYSRVQAPDGKTKTVATATKSGGVAGPPAGKGATGTDGKSSSTGGVGSSATGSLQQKQAPTPSVSTLVPQQQQSSLHSTVLASSTLPGGLIPNQLMSVPPPNYRYVSTGTSTAGGSGATTSSSKGGKKAKRFLRVAAGTIWEDPTLADWDPSDFRIFCGDLGNEVSVDTLSRAFNRYPSFQKAHVVRDKRTGKSRGYGFVSFSDPTDFARAMREMNGKYVGNRPIKLKRSDWRVRQLESFKKKEKEKKKLGLKN